MKSAINKSNRYTPANQPFGHVMCMKFFVSVQHSSGRARKRERAKEIPWLEFNSFAGTLLLASQSPLLIIRYSHNVINAYVCAMDWWCDAAHKHTHTHSVFSYHWRSCFVYLLRTFNIAYVYLCFCVSLYSMFGKIWVLNVV